MQNELKYLRHDTAGVREKDHIRKFVIDKIEIDSVSMKSKNSK